MEEWLVLAVKRALCNEWMPEAVGAPRLKGRVKHGLGHCCFSM